MIGEWYDDLESAEDVPRTLDMVFLREYITCGSGFGNQFLVTSDELTHEQHEKDTRFIHTHLFSMPHNLFVRYFRFGGGVPITAFAEAYFKERDAGKSGQVLFFFFFSSILFFGRHC